MLHSLISGLSGLLQTGKSLSYDIIKIDESSKFTFLEIVIVFHPVTLSVRKF